MKYLVIFILLLSTNVIAKTPQQILKEDGFVFVTKEADKEIYYRPKEVKKYDGIVYYSTTILKTSGANKYGLRSDYMALGCKEKLVLKTGIHNVPYIGKSSYTDLTKKGVKGTDFKPLSALDKRMHAKLCK